MNLNEADVEIIQDNETNVEILQYNEADVEILQETFSENQTVHEQPSINVFCVLYFCSVCTEAELLKNKGESQCCYRQ